MAVRTPVMLITGALGSGKTTLLRRILENPPRRTAVLMNEFGEIGIDGRVIQGKNVRVVELAGGCVCCSLAGEFEAAVREILELARPELIVVEATGVAEADALAFEVEESLPEVRLDSVVCVVDAYLGTRHPRIGYTTRNHIAAANIVLVNKVDLIATDEIRAVEGRVREFNATAPLFRTVGCDVDMEVLLGTGLSRKAELLPAHGDAPFDSFSWSSRAVLDAVRFRAVASSLPEEVIRAKGFVRFAEGSFLFNYVVGRSDFEAFEAGATELVFIGRGLKSIRDSVEAALKACETSPEEAVA